MDQPPERFVPDRNRRYTLEEYFALDDASDVKYEYWEGLLVPHGGWERDRHGDIIGMAGGTAEHGDIAANVLRELGNRLKGTPCKAVGSDVRVRSPRMGKYHYPDVTVTCGPRQFDRPDRHVTLTNPQVLVEVLSSSTASDDRGEKFREYIAIESLQQYVLVSQDAPRVETFHRNADGMWVVGPCAEGLDAAVTFPSLGVTLPLSELYAGVEFPSARPPR